MNMLILPNNCVCQVIPDKQSFSSFKSGDPILAPVLLDDAWSSKVQRFTELDVIALSKASIELLMPF
jgi:hypothetical protein